MSRWPYHPGNFSSGVPMPTAYPIPSAPRQERSAGRILSKIPVSAPVAPKLDIAWFVQLALQHSLSVLDYHLLRFNGSSDLGFQRALGLVLPHEQSENRVCNLHGSPALGQTISEYRAVAEICRPFHIGQTARASFTSPCQTNRRATSLSLSVTTSAVCLRVLNWFSLKDLWCTRVEKWDFSDIPAWKRSTRSFERQESRLRNVLKAVDRKNGLHNGSPVAPCFERRRFVTKRPTRWRSQMVSVLCT
jgi:hypothetical protein